MITLEINMNTYFSNKKKTLLLKMPISIPTLVILLNSYPICTKTLKAKQYKPLSHVFLSSGNKI